MPNVLFEMTGASIVRWQAGDAVVLAVHGAFDGASAWALRLAMEESEATRFVVDLTHAVEAFEFAASILANFAREARRTKRVAFLPGTPDHARLLAGFGLELIEDELEIPIAGPRWSAETDLESGATA
jgi:anti-anti-sigma regulatory factor